MQTDTLSNVLRVIRLSGGVFVRLELSPPFAFGTLDAETLRQYLAPESEQILPFHLVNKGPVWFHIEGSDPVKLETNDILVLPDGAGHGLSDSRDQELVAVPNFLADAQGTPQTFTWPGSGDSEETRVLCGFFSCHARIYSPLLDSLPSVMVIRHDPERTPWLAATLQRTFDESLARRPGGNALIEQLTSLLFMEVVQRQLEKDSSGWLGALSDPVLGQVLQFIHQQPAQTWTVESLAKRAGSSSSVVAERFADTIGISPIKYLTQWRLELAAGRLLDSNDSIAEIALDIGYASEASLNRAFKRHVGTPPATWRTSKRQRLSVNR
ncbi:MAG: AraC family transcriptional regulator [Kofleriaceae bacterium]|nr:AraC family transcriptional regulator [Kofleriaceae bacterium]